MHPALSVIVFTSLSGAGYGMLFWAGLLLAAGLLPANGAAMLTVLAVGAFLVVVGLSSSTLHLGHPERAWRALSQWRSSWLSREGVAAVFGFLPLLVLVAAVMEWIPAEPWLAASALVVAAMAAVTVHCTAMIYASLRPIKQWHHPLVPVSYFAFAAMSGSLWLLGTLTIWGLRPSDSVIGTVAAITTLAWSLKWLYWHEIDRPGGASSAASATGLTGNVRLLDPPHTEENYLLKEMGYRVARAHGRKLRRWAVLAGWAVPTGCLLVDLAWSPGFTPLFVVAALSNMLGILIERWLFFAQATHTVTLYYGAVRA